MPSDLRLTRHAKARLQQRCIPALMLPVLEAYGSEAYQKGGTIIWHLPRKSAERLRREMKELLKRMDALEDAYFVESEAGLVITAGHRP